MTFEVEKNVPRTTKRVGISGEAGKGKSSAIFKLYKNPLMFDLDKKLPPETEGLGQKIKLKEESYMGIKSALMGILASPKPQNDAIVFDTVTKVQEFIEDHALQFDYGGQKAKYSAFQSGPKHELPQYFAEFLNLVSKVEQKHGIDILFVCHATRKPVNNATGKDYTKMVLNLREEVAAKLLQHLDYLGFVWDDVEIKLEGLHSKAVDAERFISFDNSNPAFDAKALKVLPSKIPFDREGKWVEAVFGKDKS